MTATLTRPSSASLRPRTAILGACAHLQRPAVAACGYTLQPPLADRGVVRGDVWGNAVRRPRRQFWCTCGARPASGRCQAGMLLVQHASWRRKAPCSASAVQYDLASTTLCQRRSHQRQLMSGPAARGCLNRPESLWRSENEKVGRVDAWKGALEIDLPHSKASGLGLGPTITE